MDNNTYTFLFSVPYIDMGTRVYTEVEVWAGNYSTALKRLHEIAIEVGITVYGTPILKKVTLTLIKK